MRKRITITYSDGNKTHTQHFSYDGRKPRNIGIVVAKLKSQGYEVHVSSPMEMPFVTSADFIFSVRCNYPEGYITSMIARGWVETKCIEHYRFFYRDGVFASWSYWDETIWFFRPSRLLEKIRNFDNETLTRLHAKMVKFHEMLDSDPRYAEVLEMGLFNKDEFHWPRIQGMVRCEMLRREQFNEI